MMRSCFGIPDLSSCCPRCWSASLKSFGINQEYQRGVLFRLGRLGPMKGPGWYWLIPFVDRVVRVDLRIITYQLETQETITRDGVAVRVNAVLWFRAEFADAGRDLGRELERRRRSRRPRPRCATRSARASSTRC